MSNKTAITPGFMRNLETTNRIIPSIKEDGLIKLIAKVALIFCTCGIIFIATIGYDLTKKIISKFRPSKPSYPELEGKDKYVKYAQTIYAGLKEGTKSIIGSIKYIPDTTAKHFHGHQSPYNYIGQTAGFAISTTALLTLVGGKYGFLTGVALNGYGLLPKSFEKPIEKAYEKVEKFIWPQTDKE